MDEYAFSTENCKIAEALSKTSCQLGCQLGCQLVVNWLSTGEKLGEVVFPVQRSSRAQLRPMGTVCMAQRTSWGPAGLSEAVLSGQGVAYLV